MKIEELPDFSQTAGEYITAILLKTIGKHRILFLMTVTKTVLSSIRQIRDLLLRTEKLIL